MEAGQCTMLAEHAPPGFWQRAGSSALIAGVAIESCVPTRFFQSLDAYPPEWGRLNWRVQLNKVESGHAVSPVFRTFYPGVEWNLKRPGYRWFLTAWFKWEGPGPPQPVHPTGARIDEELHIEADTVLFRFAWIREPDSALFLRSRVDARERKRISETLRSQPARQAKAESAVIVLDDILKA